MGTKINYEITSHGYEMTLNKSDTKWRDDEMINT